MPEKADLNRRCDFGLLEEELRSSIFLGCQHDTVSSNGSHLQPGSDSTHDPEVGYDGTQVL